MNLEIANRLQKLRKEKGYSQEQLAEALGISRQAVSKWEKDDSYPSIEFLPVLASLFGVTIDYLIIGATKSEKTGEITPKKVEEEILADDPRIKAAIHNGILHIDEILVSKNYKLIKIPGILFEPNKITTKTTITNISAHPKRPNIIITFLLFCYITF